MAQKEWVSELFDLVLTQDGILLTNQKMREIFPFQLLSGCQSKSRI